MKPLRALLLSDRRPGHYHLADGVLAAIERRRPVAVTRIEIRRRHLTPTRLLGQLLQRGAPATHILRLGYGLAAKNLPTAADLVISAGGDTIAANVASALLLDVPNIFCGSLRHVPPALMALTISSFAEHAELPNHLITLKPGGIDPDDLAGLPGAIEPHPVGPDHPPVTAGLLIGGNSGEFTFGDNDWHQLTGFLAAAHQAHGTSWIVSTSRRTPDNLADNLARLAGEHNSPIVEYIDYRHAGPGTLPGLFARSAAILCTADSSSMISESICARRPVVGVTPGSFRHASREAQYRQFLQESGWTRTITLDELTPQGWLKALGTIAPLQDNHLDRLVAQLHSRLPQLFRT